MLKVNGYLFMGNKISHNPLMAAAFINMRAELTLIFYYVLCSLEDNS